MEDIKIDILRHPTEEDWQWVKLLALNTMGKAYLMDKEIEVFHICFHFHCPLMFLYFCNCSLSDLT